MQNEKEKAIDVDKLLKNKLKNISVGQLEDEIAGVVSKMVGEDYKCQIGEIKYTLFSGADFHVKVELSYNSEEE